MRLPLSVATYVGFFMEIEYLKSSATVVDRDCVNGRGSDLSKEEKFCHGEGITFTFNFDSY